MKRGATVSVIAVILVAFLLPILLVKVGEWRNQAEWRLLTFKELAGGGALALLAVLGLLLFLVACINRALENAYLWRAVSVLGRAAGVASICALLWMTYRRNFRRWRRVGNEPLYDPQAE